LAAAISRTQKAKDLLAAKQLPDALAEALQAVALAPDAVEPNAVTGDVLSAMQRTDDARQYYQKALKLAKTVQPDFQVGWAAALEAKLAK